MKFKATTLITDVDSSLKGPLCTMATKTAANNPVKCKHCNQDVERDKLEWHQAHECQKQEDKLKNLQEISSEIRAQQQATERLREQQEVTERRLQEQQQVTEQRLREQQQITERFQEQQEVTEQRLREQQQITERFQEQQEVTEQRLREQQQITERFQEQQEVTEQRLREQQQVTERLQRENRNLLNELNGVIRNQQRDHSQVWMITITIAVAILLALVIGLSQEQTVTITKQESVNMTHVQALNKSMALFAQQELTQLRKILCPGSTANRPASSCGQILSCDPSSTSGYYWIASLDGNRTVHMYCSMSETCEKRSGGWMRVAELDMTNSSNQCPSGLQERKDYSQRLCTKDTNDGGCSNVFFKVSNISYDQVCGKIIAYQYGSPNSFHTGGPIDGVYLDGISLTNCEPREHIWSFGAGLDEVGSYPSSNCPCTNTTLAASATAPPDFVGNDYFCDTGSTNEYQKNHLYFDDPLWDGDGCGPDNTCCSLNNPPWFFKQLQSSTSEDIEMRVCCDESHEDEDIYIKQIELYVR